MLFKNYHIVIFKDREGECRSLRLRGWFCMSLLFLFIALMAGNVYLWGFYSRALLLEHEVNETGKTLYEQHSQIIGMASTLQGIQETLARVQQFDTKLRVMMNVNSEPVDTNSSEDALDHNPFRRDANLPLHRQDLLAKRMYSLVERLKEDLFMEEITQQDLLHTLRDNKEFLSSMPSIWPAEGHLSSGFGYRYSPLTGQKQLHKGLDISNRPGTPIIAPGRGIVLSSGWDSGYGLCVVISHGNGLITRYGHMLKSVVKEGQEVMRGDLIGHIGNSGRSTGPHLHYEVHVGGVAVNPLRYIFN